MKLQERYKQIKHNSIFYKNVLVNLWVKFYPKETKYSKVFVKVYNKAWANCIRDTNKFKKTQTKLNCIRWIYSPYPETVLKRIEQFNKGGII